MNVCYGSKSNISQYLGSLGNFPQIKLDILRTASPFANYCTVQNIQSEIYQVVIN